MADIGILYSKIQIWLNEWYHQKEGKFDDDIASYLYGWYFNWSCKLLVKESRKIEYGSYDSHTLPLASFATFQSPLKKRWNETDGYSSIYS